MSNYPATLYSILSSLVHDLFSDDLWDACIAGSTWDSDMSDFGMTIELSGYSDTISTLLERMTPSMRKYRVDPIRMHAMKAEVGPPLHGTWI